MNDSWDLSDIFFVNDTSVNTAVPELGQAYVSRSFASKPKSTDIKWRSRSFIQNEMVFALGVALLELSFGRPLLSFKTQDDLDSHGQETMFTEYSIAHRLIKNIDSRELPYFASAVTRCIRLNFDTNSTRLDDSEFMHMYYRGVVEPLQNLHTFATTK
ncbi:hypothetical protein GJ744_010207 [Endocarpon pusillum]|uniref:DUF7580 domain-containing protein n=1 Tax=Endocarpon pusillum TaxID=364733 RepID=A0A8H7E210_9EURO|nr:hypothetical protein GJ744_010207 [Endocarpon pusillum]